MTAKSPRVANPNRRPRAVVYSGPPSGAASPRVGNPNRRQRGVRLAVFIVLALFVVKLVQIQVIDAESMAAEGLASRMATSSQPAVRGSVLAADGTVLASDEPRYEVQANQQEIALYKHRDEDGNVIGKGAKEAAKLLAPILNRSEAELFDLLYYDTEDPTAEPITYIPLIKDATLDQWQPIADLDIRGIFGPKYYQRTYPTGGLAGNITGFRYETTPDDLSEEARAAYEALGDDAVAKLDFLVRYTGLEGVYNDILSGTASTISVEIGGGGQAIPGGQVIEDPGQPGCDLTLTIDAPLQWQTQSLLDAQVDASGSRYGVIVVEDVTTGEILALADSHSVDPNDAGATAADARGSLAVETVFEPGSTGKVVTMAMLLETGEATPTTTYTVPDEITLGGQDYVDSHPHATAQWTLNGILSESSNTGTILAAQNVSDQTRYDYLRKFGFGSPTGIELPNEAPGIVHVPGTSSWDGRTRNVILFGQGVSVNALQATGVFATLGNQGMAEPIHLVKGTQCPGQQFEPAAQAPASWVVSPSTANQLVAMMESVVGQGTGRSAQIPGYRVAGKTGTTQVLGPTGSVDYYVGSFVGLAPAENPRIAVGVFMVDPQTSEYGAVVAAPTFAEVTSFALQRLNVPPSTTSAPSVPTTW